MNTTPSGPRELPPSYEETMGQMPRETVIRAIIIPIEWSSSPMYIQCPYCRNIITTIAQSQPNMMTNLAAFLLCIFGLRRSETCRDLNQTIFALSRLKRVSLFQHVFCKANKIILWQNI